MYQDECGHYTSFIRHKRYDRSRDTWSVMLAWC